MTSTAHPEPRKGSIQAIFLTVFLDMLAFGMFIPDIQLRAERSLLATGYEIGFTLAVFSLTQLLTAPIMGRISDGAGRKRVLLISSFLSFVSYLLYSHVQDLATLVHLRPLYLMWISRGLSGIAAANIGVAFAYVADVTTPENRAKGLGFVGMGLGLGFVLGPPAGGFLLHIGNNSPLVLGYVAATLVAINLFYIYFSLPESSVGQGAKTPSLWANTVTAFGNPQLAVLLAMFFAANFGFTNLETTYFRLLASPSSIFHLPEAQAKTAGAVILLFVGIGIAFCQGFLVQKLQPKFGEVKLLRLGYLLIVPGLFLCPILPLWGPALIVVGLLSIGNGLSQPNMSSLISRAAPRTMQGGIFGITQALGALARCIGPLLSNTLFDKDPRYPYFLGAMVVAIPAVAAWVIKSPSKSGDSDPEDLAIAH